MTQHQIPAALGAGTPVAPHPGVHATTWRNRLAARVYAGRYDRRLEDCVPVRPGSALAVHATRITAAREREELARALRSALQQGRRQAPRGVITTALPVNRAITTTADVLDAVTLRLHAPLPVHPRGMARLRLLLSDGGGPLYWTGRGSLAAELRGVLAAL
jgi:hypothetical protein